MSGISEEAGLHPGIPDDVLVQWQRLCLLTARATGAAACHVVEAAGSNLVTRAAAGEKAGELSVLAGECDRRVLESREPLVLEDTAADSAGRAAAFGGAGAYIGLPIAWPDGAVFGVVAVLHEQPRIYAAADHEMLVVCASALAHDLARISREDQRAPGIEERPAEVSPVRGVGDEFFASVVHELRTPLVSILGASDALLGGMSGRITDPQQRLLEIVKRGGERLVRLVDNLREFVRVEAGRFTVTRERMDLREPVRQAMVALRPLAENAGVQLVGDLPPREVWVDGDADRLLQVTTNLVENAVRHAHREVSVVVRAWSGAAELAVSDDGHGILPDEAEALFAPWSRVEAGRGPATAHLGLGLTIVRHLVSAHGGTVRAVSPPPPELVASAPPASGFACIVRIPILD